MSTTRAAMGGDPELTPGADPAVEARQSAAEASQAAARAERRQARKERWRLLRRRPGFVIGCLIVLFWIVCAIGGSRITPYDPINDLSEPFLKPRSGHWFGTDDLGRVLATC